MLKVGPTPDGKGARNVTVVPIENEAALRNRAWIEGNLHKVDKLSGGAWPTSTCRIPALAATRRSTATSLPRSDAKAP